MNDYEELLIKQNKRQNTVVGKLLNLFTRHSRSSESVVIDWLQQGNSVCMLSIANEIAENVKDELKLNHVSFATLKKNRHSLFFVRNIDESALDLCVAAVRYRISKETTIYTYQEFNDYVATNASSNKIAYLTGLSEVEMEYLRRDLLQKGGGKSFSITRMDDNSWMMGFLTDDLIDLNPIKRRYSPVMESIFRMTLDLYGKKGAEMQRRLRSNISADRRMAKTTEGERRTSSRSFYVYDPIRPKRSIYLSKDYWCVLETKDLHSPEVVFMPKNHNLFSQPGAMEKLNCELMSMQYKAVCYDETTLYRSVMQYQNRDQTEEKAIQNYQDANKELSKSLYDVFASRHVNDKEYQSQNIGKQVFICLTEAQILIQGIINHEIIDKKFSRLTDATLENYDLTPEDFQNVSKYFNLEPVIEREAKVAELSLIQRLIKAEKETQEEQAIAESIVIEKGD